MNKWLVMGANSFSGRAFVRFLESNGQQVQAFMRPGFDLNRSYDMTGVALQSDYVVNFAALNMVADSWQHYADYYRTNVIGVGRFARACMKLKGLKRFIQVSTPEVYGSTGVFLNEDSPCNPSTPYAVSRAAADMDLMALHRTHGFPVSFMRSVNVYGAGQQPYRIIPKTVLKILRGERLRLEGGGVSTRSFIHINDVARSIVAVAYTGRCGEVYHTSTPVQTAISGLVWQICRLLEVKSEDFVENAPERPGKDMSYKLNCEKILRDTNWRYQIKLEDGLKETVAWFKQHADDYINHSLEYQHRG